MGLAFVPLYIKFMGIEAFGLVGFFLSLTAVFAILDVGLGQTLNRELARLSVKRGHEQEMKDILRSLELIYWAIALFIGLIVILLAPIIAQYWITSSTIDSDTVEQIVLIMGLVITIQWPTSLYLSGLRGLQKLVHLNGINIIYSTVKGAGAVAVLWFIAPTLQIFFLWQIFIAFCYVLILAYTLRFFLPKTENKARFQKKLIIGIWKFAFGVSGITILSALTAQADKIILSKLLSLEMFGYYTLATTLAMSINRLIYPISGGIYPRITQLVSSGDSIKVSQLYHKSCQLLSVVLFPVTFIIAMFSYEILFLWTQNDVTAENTFILARILIFGTAFLGLANMPNKLQVAYGWTKLGFHINLISILIYIPLLIFVTSAYGAIGACTLLATLNGISLLFTIHLMHKRLLINEKWNWYIKDLSLPLIVSFSLTLLGKILLGNQNSQLLIIITLGFLFIITITIASFTTDATRIWIIDFIKKARNYFG